MSNAWETAVSQPYYLFASLNVGAGSGAMQIAGGTTDNAVLQRSAASPGVFRVNAGTQLSMGGNIVISNWTTVVAYFNGSNSWIRTNGVAAVSGDAGTNAWEGVRLGATSGAQSYFNGWLHEIFLTSDTLTTNELQTLEEYLDAKMMP